MAQGDQRTHAKTLMKWFVDGSTQISYQQLRPMWMMENLPYEQMCATYLYEGNSISPDCSEIVTMICKYAGLRDPSGFGYNTYGNSQTMYNNLRHYYDAKKALTASIIEYKDNNGVSVHVNMVYEADATNGNPMLFNHGGPGCRFITYKDFLAALPNYHPTFLVVGDL